MRKKFSKDQILARQSLLMSGGLPNNYNSNNIFIQF